MKFGGIGHPAAERIGEIGGGIGGLAGRGVEAIESVEETHATLIESAVALKDVRLTSLVETERPPQGGGERVCAVSNGVVAAVRPAGDFVSEWSEGKNQFFMRAQWRGING